MSSMVVFAIVANVFGLALVSLSLFLLGRNKGSSRAWFSSYRKPTPSALLVTGFLLTAGGQYELQQAAYGPAPRAEARARVQSVLQQPLRRLTVQLFGSNPFRHLADSCTLRLRIVA